MPVSRIRKIVFLLFVAFVVASLFVDSGFGTLSSFGIGKVAALCPVGFLESFLGGKTINTQGVLCFVLLLVLAVVLGKWVCSWICPIPRLQSLLPSKRKRVQASSVIQAEQGETASNAHPHCSHCAQAGCEAKGALPPIGGQRDGARIDSRHFVLVGALATTALFGFPVFCLVCPIGLTFATLIAVIALFQSGTFAIDVLLFPAILALEIFLLRDWCQSFCPVSALLSLVARKGIFFRPEVEQSKCLRTQGTDCRVCVEACPEWLDPHSTSIPECSKCYACIEQCPAKAIRFRFLLRGKEASPSSSESD